MQIYSKLSLKYAFLVFWCSSLVAATTPANFQQFPWKAVASHWVNMSQVNVWKLSPHSIKMKAYSHHKINFRTGKLQSLNPYKCVNANDAYVRLLTSADRQTTRHLSFLPASKHDHYLAAYIINKTHQTCIWDVSMYCVNNLHDFYCCFWCIA